MDGIEAMLCQRAEQTERAIEDLLETTRKVERIDTLHALARYLNCKGEHAAAEILRTDPHVFRFSRQQARGSQS